MHEFLQGEPKRAFYDTTKTTSCAILAVALDHVEFVIGRLLTQKKRAMCLACLHAVLDAEWLSDSKSGKRPTCGRPGTNGGTLK